MTERLTRDEFLAALASGRKDFSGCDLSGLGLSGLDLSGANLFGADLLNCAGLYSACTPFMSSCHDALYAGVFERDGERVLLFSTGLRSGLTADEVRAWVKEQHTDNANAAQYEAAIAFIEACVASDLAAGRFETKETQS